MKKIVSLFAALLLGISSLYAKDQLPGAQLPPLKIGYINFEYILKLLPDLKAAQSELSSLEKQLNKHLAAKFEDYQKKEEAYKKGSKTADESARKQQKLELQQLERNIRQFQLESSEKLNNKHTNLISPIYNKVQDTVAQVAQDHGYTYVLNTSLEGVPILLYADEEHNISDRVLRKLGVDPGQARDEKK